MSSPGDDGQEPEKPSHRRPVEETPQPEQSELTVGETKEGPTPAPTESRDSPIDDELQMFIRDIVTSVLAVFLLGGYIFMISGVWPPMVAIESGSMEPNMEVNDLVFVMETERFQPSEAQGQTGVVTAQRGSETGYSNYGGYGDVVVFAPDGNENQTPVIHRAMFWVEEGENWYDRANEEHIGGADSCEEVSASMCDAPHDGFITKGDNNPTYDQAGGANMEPVKPEWVVGTAEVRLPRLGWLRLRFQ